MQQAVTTSRRVIEYRDVADPTPAPGTAVIAMHAVTLCGTDLHIWDDDYATELPIIQGHEAAGTIQALDPADKGGVWRVGDRVAISPMSYCGTCYACSVGRVNACRHMSVYGCYEDGSLVTAQAVPLEKLYRVPDRVDLGLAPLSEPISIAMQAVQRGRAQAGEKVLVSGAGPIGLLATVYLKDLGCDVTVADVNPTRLALALGMGADRALEVSPGNFPTAAQQAGLATLTNGNGPSLVIDATGAPASVATGVDLVATAGRVVCVGISDAELRLTLRTVPVKELDLLGSRNSQNLIGQALDLLDRYQQVIAPMITHRFGFHELDRAFAALADPDAGVGKAAIDFPDAPDDRSGAAVAAGATGSAASAGALAASTHHNEGAVA
ncbi:MULTISPECIES: alcohol dehydrogenase catalytic domain-containing protein [Micrococcaceae]|uniref:alcohol dehydrogenase catalytic domain-containing protein n=1 Tax=Micrococcaceae TaxID=1268 RepID=UPI00160E39A2|nr:MULTISPECIES: alcohol dehydrogenase catalytic domain-containing protein [Micrococcaceae]MBB5750094.1 L-gulonate 5-dehydrogenase [Micrococcus sp. TA1]HRO94845.1 alcohol dehydrogenase catalytic domain-containing protein [Citricoccus sp.]